MDKELNDKIISYIGLIRTVLPLEMAVLYGSYANNTQRKDSDIDLALVVNDLPDDFLEVYSILYNKVLNYDYRIEPVMISKKHDRSGFLESILSYGKVLYSKE